MKALLNPEVYNQLQTHFETTDKWKNLDEAYVNFTHFAPIADSSEEFAFTKDGLFASWHRHVAYCPSKLNFPRTDIIIPMAFRCRKRNTIDPNRMSYIIISVKCRHGNEMIRESFLTRDCVEGVPDTTNSKTKGDDATVRLTLHKLKFINPGGIPGSGDISNDAWVETTKDKPFIAFAMSMGNTTRTTKLFVGEENVTSSIRLFSNY